MTDVPSSLRPLGTSPTDPASPEPAPVPVMIMEFRSHAPLDTAEVAQTPLGAGEIPATDVASPEPTTDPDSPPAPPSPAGVVVTGQHPLQGQPTLALIARAQQLIEEARMRNGAASLGTQDVLRQLSAAPGPVTGLGASSDHLGLLHAETASCLSELGWIMTMITASLAERERQDGETTQRKLDQLLEQQRGLKQSLSGVWGELRNPASPRGLPVNMGPKKPRS